MVAPQDSATRVNTFVLNIRQAYGVPPLSTTDVRLLVALKGHSAQAFQLSVLVQSISLSLIVSNYLGEVSYVLAINQACSLPFVV